MPIKNRVRPIAYESLPEGYTRCEYLESTGTQWIDTGFTPKIGDELNLDFFINDKFVNNPLFSAGDGENQIVAVVTTADYHKPYFYQRYFNKQASKVEIPDLQKINCNIDKNGSIFINGTYCGKSTPAGEVNTSLLLFKRVSSSAICQCHIYTFSISRNGQLQLNLIPCLDPKGKPCMFDLVSRTPFYNQSITDPDFLYKAYSYPFNPGNNWHTVNKKIKEIVGSTKYTLELIEDGE